MDVECVELLPDEIDPEVALAAKASHLVACHDLDLEGITLRYFAPAGSTSRPGRKRFRQPAEWDGFFFSGAPNEIWVKATVDPATAARNVAHELRHAWQHRHWHWAKCHDSPTAEADASSYTDAFAARYLSAVPSWAPPKPKKERKHDPDWEWNHAAGCWQRTWPII